MYLEMYKYIAADEAMKRSISFFEHQGIFLIHLQKLLTKDMMRSLLSALGCTSAGTIEQNSTDGFIFTTYLYTHGFISEKTSDGKYPNYEKTVYSRDALPLKNAAIQCGYIDVVNACNKWMGLDDNDGLNLQPHVVKSGKYETVDDLLTDEDNFGLIIMNLYLQLEKLWPQSVERFIESGIDITINQNAIQQKTMKGKFYLETIRNVKLADFLSNLDAIGCSSVKDIDEKLQQLNATIIHEKKTSFSGKNEVASWCNDNGLSHLYDKLIEMGFDTIDYLKRLDDQSCAEMDIKGRFRIELLDKIKQLK